MDPEKNHNGTKNSHTIIAITSFPMSKSHPSKREMMHFYKYNVKASKGGMLGPAWLFSWDLLCLVFTLVSPP
jgi:hypothetical protein